jgi:signal transduction histidine kinase
MISIEQTKKAFQIKLFLIFEMGKVLSSSALFIIFYVFVQDNRLDYMYNLNIMIVISGLFGILGYKLFDKDLKYIHYISLIINYGLFMGFLILAKNPYSTIFFWLVSGLTLTFYMTNVYFSALISAGVIAFIVKWPYSYINVEELKYELFANGAFQDAFNISLVLLIIFLFFLTYISERSRTKIYEDLIAANRLTESEKSFPKHNPNPIFEYLKDGSLISRNDLAEEFVSKAVENELSIISNYAQAVHLDNDSHTTQLILGSKHFLVNFIPVSDKVNIYLTDISALIQTQENLSIKEMENNAIIDAIPGFVSWIDRDLNYLGVNSQFSEFFNKKKSDFIGKSLGTVETMENKKFRSLITDLMNDDSKDSMTEEINYFHEEKEYWNFLKINKYNKGNRAVLVSTDITDLKAAQGNLIKEQRKNDQTERLAALGEMSAGISHEINNPLAVIKASLGRLTTLKEKGRLTDENLKEMIETGIYGVDRIQKIISGLKNLSRDGIEDKYEDVLLQDVIDDATVLIPQTCLHLGIDLRINSPKNVRLICQRVQISQVLVIFINNAIDALKDISDLDAEKWIQVDIVDSHDKLSLTVMDSGVGISSDVKEKIFNPFFTTKNVGNGTGLGLSLADKIIKSHEGSIELDESSSNTKFIININKNLS